MRDEELRSEIEGHARHEEESALKIDDDRTKAAAELHSLAQAHALLRLYREREGREAASPMELAEWVRRQPQISEPIEPTAADRRQAVLERPDLAARAIGRRPNASTG